MRFITNLKRPRLALAKHLSRTRPPWNPFSPPPPSIAHIVLVYALVISVGLALGRIKVFGVSLGVHIVLFVGLAAGHFGMAIEPHV